MYKGKLTDVYLPHKDEQFGVLTITSEGPLKGSLVAFKSNSNAYLKFQPMLKCDLRILKKHMKAKERFFVQTRAVNEEIDQNWKYLFDRALKEEKMTQRPTQVATLICLGNAPVPRLIVNIESPNDVAKCHTELLVWLNHRKIDHKTFFNMISGAASLDKETKRDTPNTSQNLPRVENARDVNSNSVGMTNSGSATNNDKLCRDDHGLDELRTEDLIRPQIKIRSDLVDKTANSVDTKALTETRSSSVDRSAISVGTNGDYSVVLETLDILTSIKPLLGEWGDQVETAKKLCLEIEANERGKCLQALQSERFGLLLDGCAREFKIAACSVFAKIQFLQFLREASIELFPDLPSAGQTEVRDRQMRDPASTNSGPEPSVPKSPIRTLRILSSIAELKDDVEDYLNTAYKLEYENGPTGSDQLLNDDNFLYMLERVQIRLYNLVTDVSPMLVKECKRSISDLLSLTFSPAPVTNVLPPQMLMANPALPYGNQYKAPGLGSKRLADMDLEARSLPHKRFRPSATEVSSEQHAPRDNLGAPVLTNEVNTLEQGSRIFNLNKSLNVKSEYPLLFSQRDSST